MFCVDYFVFEESYVRRSSVRRSWIASKCEEERSRSSVCGSFGKLHGCLRIASPRDCHNPTSFFRKVN